LICVLAVSVLASIWLFYTYVKKSRDLRQAQTQLNFIVNRRPVIQAMVLETLEYSKTHPAIDPLLESTGIKPKGGAGATAPKSPSK